MASRRTEVAIEKIIASCDGNMRGALEALMLVNEHLEAELHRIYAVMSRIGQPDEECFETLH
ncbi:hypothetical protein [Bradyrhizobium sp.]|jgi:hypothetical protein|uniref:hypothetical protein n=1 Tax=Bradyrhizobium sp. TaxID=376 RepID=UPI003C72E12B